MDKINSFKIDHLKLKRGVYVSKKAMVGQSTITTFDLRLCKPYTDEVMDTGAIHALEHLGATVLYNDEYWGNRVLYFGPMGCRTGFYLLIAGDLTSEDILPFLERTFDKISEFEGDIPGATPKECGYCVDMDLFGAKLIATEYYNLLIDIKKDNMKYHLIKPAKTKKDKGEKD